MVDSMGGTYYGFDMNPDLWELLQDQAAREGGLVKALSSARLYTAYLPEVSPLNYTAYWRAASNTFDKNGFAFLGAPYNSAMLVVRLTGIDPQIDSEDGGRMLFFGSTLSMENMIHSPTAAVLHCEGVVEQVVALQEGFADPTGRRIELDVAIWGEEELIALGLEVGQAYMVYGRNYKDLDYELRSLVSIDQLNFEQPFSMDKVIDRGNFSIDPMGRHPLYEYKNTEGDLPEESEERMRSFDAEKLAWANACSLTVHDTSTYPRVTLAYDESGAPIGFAEDPEHRVWYHSIGEIYLNYDRIEPEDAADYMRCYHVPTIAPLTGSVEDFLADPAHGDWSQALEDTGIDHHAFPLMAVDKVGYQGDFARQQVRIVEGRDFTPQEQAAGSRVCVISQSLAVANGLSLGDQITLQNYSYDFNIEENRKDSFSGSIRTLHNGAFYSHTLGFNDQPARYTIVGLYRQDNEWHNGDSAYGFLPNMVFVPLGAVSGDAYTSNSGPYFSIVLENGKQEEFEQVLKEAGFSRCFIYYDQGYSKIVKDLDAYQETVSKAASMGAAAFAAMLGLFLFLFPGSSRATVRTMNTLGAGRGRALRHVMVSTLCLLIPGILLGTALGNVLWERFTAELMRASGTQLAISADVPALVAPLAGGLLLAGVVLTVLTAFLVTAVNPMKRE